MRSKLKLAPIIFLAITAIWLRLVNLGYSNYQGDEIKALFLPEPGQTLTSFLLDQRKGPLQFLITYLVKIINPDYSNEFVTRLPFAIAGILAIFFFYKFVELNFNKKIAFYASFFVSTNGFFIAFSRIVQYQSFVILFMIMSLYFFTLAAQNERWKIKGIYLGFITWSLSILAHYDGVFIAPFIAYLLLIWFLKYKKMHLKHIIGAVVAFGASLGLFYVPFVLTLSNSTLLYWQNRVSGGQGKVSSSKYLFTVYQPIYVLKVYLTLTALGLGSFIAKLREFKSTRNIKNLYLFGWFLVPFIFMEIFINIPGTHIYTYLVPVAIIMGMGIEFGEELFIKVVKKPKLNYLVYASIFSIFMFIFLQSNAIFVDNSKEYPWEYEQFFVWTLFKPTPSYHLSMFGFPYFRNWEEIGKYVTTQPNQGSQIYYSTNERDSMARYYIPLEKSTSKPGYRYYVFINNAQSFTDKITNEYTLNWVSTHEPVNTFIDNGRETARIYLIPNLVTTATTDDSGEDVTSNE